MWVKWKAHSDLQVAGMGDWTVILFTELGNLGGGALGEDDALSYAWVLFPLKCTCFWRRNSLILVAI